MNIGIIGAGFIAEKHAQAIHRVEGLTVAAASRRDPTLLQKFCTRFYCTGYRDYRDLLRHPGLDAVLIATPHHLHVTAVEASAAGGKHILLEKPIAPDSNGCQRIKRAVSDSGVTFMAGHSARFTPAYQKAKELVADGTIGRILYGNTWMNKSWMEPNRRDWHLDRKTGGGMLLTIGIHLLDRLLFLIDEKVTAVSATLGTGFHQQPADDYATVYLRFDGGASGFVSCTGYRQGGPLEETILVGNEGSLSIRMGEGVRIGKDDRWKEIPQSSGKDAMGDSLRAQWRAFADFVAGDPGSQAVGIDEAISVMDILFASERSSMKGHEIDLLCP